MGLVSIAKVAAMNGVIKMGTALGGIITTSVKVVELTTETEPLACIHGKLGNEVVFTVGTVATSIVG